MTMYPPERQRAITDLLIQHDGRRATVTQISEQLRVTTETVRRDLDVPERRRATPDPRRRTHGFPPFEQLAARHAEQFEDKLVIARRVAEESSRTVSWCSIRVLSPCFAPSDAEGSRPRCGDQQPPSSSVSG